MSLIGRIHRKSYDLPYQAHYLTFSCFQRQPFFKSQRAPLWFKESLEAAQTRYPFDLWAYVIMPEHVHLLILPANGVLIRNILAAIKQPVTRRALGWIEKNHPAFLSRMLDLQPNGKCTHRFWQRGGGYDRNQWTAEEIHEKIAYIHANPVRRKLVENPEEWQWSSHRAWVGGSDVPIQINRESLPPLVS